MSKEDEFISRLMSQIKSIGYYAGLAFGIGYCLTLFGVLAMAAEILVRGSNAWSRILGYVSIPHWLIASLVCSFLGVVCGIALGLSIIKNSKSARNHVLRLDTISSSVSIFSFMILFWAIAEAIAAAGLDLSMFSPICGAVGAILLLISFKVYRGEPTESKLIGAILMLVSIVLIYFVLYAPKLTLLKLLDLGFPSWGPLFSQVTLEAISLLIAIVCAIFFIFPAFEHELRQSIAGIILSMSGILFSCGVLYFNFSAVSAVNDYISLINRAFSYIGQPPFVFPWIMLFGFLILGISGIIALVTACLHLALSAKQLSTRLEAPKAPEVAPPKSVANVKYCTKCGASMSLDSVYCPKCGQKQPEA